MTSTRHLIEDDLYSDMISISKRLGYKAKGKDSYQKLLRKLLSYAKEHPSLFEI